MTDREKIASLKNEIQRLHEEVKQLRIENTERHRRKAATPFDPPSRTPSSDSSIDAYIDCMRRKAWYG